jgi:hypothetical protein
MKSGQNELSVENSKPLPENPDSIDKIYKAFFKIHRNACGQDERTAYMSIPPDEANDADRVVVRAIQELEALRATRAPQEAAAETHTCPDCDGSGATSYASHDCGGEESLCARRCPVEVPEQCPRCGGTGKVIEAAPTSREAAAAEGEKMDEADAVLTEWYRDASPLLEVGEGELLKQIIARALSQAASKAREGAIRVLAKLEAAEKSQIEQGADTPNRRLHATRLGAFYDALRALSPQTQKE